MEVYDSFGESQYLPVITRMWMAHKHLRKLIIDWFNRSQGKVIQFDIFDRFASLWIAFNSWMGYESQNEHDRDMIEWAKTNADLKNTYAQLISNDSRFVQVVKALKDMCPVERNREYKGSREVNIADIKNFDEVLEAVYVIRCNFFHGQKSPENQRDRCLVELAFRILEKLFSPTVKKLSSSDW
jgi:hypothetical protein